MALDDSELKWKKNSSGGSDTGSSTVKEWSGSCGVGLQCSRARWLDRGMVEGGRRW
jgi:hypothetical protein